MQLQSLSRPSRRRCVAFIGAVRGYLRKDSRLNIYLRLRQHAEGFSYIVTERFLSLRRSLYKSVFIFTYIYIYIFQIFCMEEEDLLVGPFIVDLKGESVLSRFLKSLRVQ